MAAPMRRAAPVTSTTGRGEGADITGLSGACRILSASVPRTCRMSTDSPSRDPSARQREAQALPLPDADALAHSGHLQALIRAQIAEHGGAIPFSRFMELALYAPGLGYYSAGASKFGESGDFITAPELGPVFAACVAESIAPVLQQLGTGARMLETRVLETRMLEIGGGTGAFAEVALKRLLELDALPDRYAILEPSAQLRERQRERLQQ